MFLHVKAIVKILATAFGAGYSPIAPGTCGTAVTVPLVWALSSRSWWAWALIAAAITALAIAVAHRADRIWGSSDNQRIVIDEVAGYCITMIPVERGHWAPLAVGFVVFRLLDIFKPPPIRWFDENLSGGLGVVADDAVAGMIGAGLMAALGYFGAFDALAGI
jgi:phosphatidylglycerophosphatase A